MFYSCRFSQKRLCSPYVPKGESALLTNEELITKWKRSEEYLFAPPEVSKSGFIETICEFIMKNGYRIIGKSVCIDPVEFDIELGKELALEDAIGKLRLINDFIEVDAFYRKQVRESGGKLDYEFH